MTLPSTDVDLVASTELQRNIVNAMNDVVDKINRIEIMRMQVEDLRARLTGNKELDTALAAIYKRMYDTELNFLSRTEMHSDDKWYVEKYKLYMNLVWLLAEVGGSGGDVAGGVAYRPTNASLQRLRGSAEGARGRKRGLQETAAGRGGVQQGQRGQDSDDHGQDAARAAALMRGGAEARRLEGNSEVFAVSASPRLRDSQLFPASAFDIRPAPRG